MQNKTYIKYIDNKYKYFFLIFLLFVTIFTRIGYWNTIIIAERWDEISYLIAGRNIFAGQIPYIDFWDHKTIFAFLPYIFASLGENQILNIRIVGTFSVFLTSVLIFFQLKKLFNTGIAQICSLVFILLNSNPYYQNTGLTVIAYPLIAYLSLILLDKNKFNASKCFLIGLLVSLICLIKINYFTIVFVVYYVIYLNNKKNLISNCFNYTLGGLFFPLLWLLYYSFFDNGISILYNSVFLNIVSTGEQLNFIWNIREIIRYIFKDITGSIFLITILFNFIILFLKKNENYLIISLLFLSSILSILLVYTGSFQLNNIFVFMTLSLGLILNYLNFDMYSNKFYLLINEKYKSKFNSLSTIILIFALTIPILLNSTILIIKNYSFFVNSNKYVLSYSAENLDKNKSAINEIRKYIKKEDTIYAYDNFFYLLLDKESPTKLLHSSSIFKLKENFFKNIYGVEDTTEKEFEKIFSKKPNWLIIREKIFLPGKGQNLSKTTKDQIYGGWKLFKKIEGFNTHLLFKIKNK